MIDKILDVGHVRSTSFTLFVSGLLLTHRKLTSDIFAVLLTVLAVYLSYKVDIMLGLIPVAILTTISKK